MDREKELDIARKAFKHLSDQEFAAQTDDSGNKFEITELELQVAIDCIEQVLEMTVPDTSAHQRNWDITKDVLEKLKKKRENQKASKS